MASATVKAYGVFPAGTALTSHLLADMREGAAPASSSIAGATMNADGVTGAAFSGLADLTNYVAYAQVGGVHRYLRFATPPAAAAAAGTTTAELHRQALLPAGALDETCDRESASTLTAFVSGVLRLAGFVVARAGVPVSGVSFMTGSTGGATLTNQFFAIVRKSDLAVLAKTVDDGATAWGANTVKRLAIPGTWVPSQDEICYLGGSVVATTMPQVLGCNSNAGVNAVPPLRNGSSSTGLTDPASLGPTAAAVGAASAVTPWAWID